MRNREVRRRHDRQAVSGQPAAIGSYNFGPKLIDDSRQQQLTTDHGQLTTDHRSLITDN
jgi:hypothetical protein